MERTTCIFCSNGELVHIYNQPHFPNVFCRTINNESVRFTDLIWEGCTKCDIVQLKTLIDADELYSSSHNNTFNTSTWKQHHLSFLEFIDQNRKSQTVLEVGGGMGFLATLMKDKVSSYTILDLAKNEHTDLCYIQANCETFTYDTYPCVIMSHVFEHLYNPVEFVKRISASNVHEVFISVPNLQHGLKTKSFSFIHNEHTFYFEESDLIHIFSKYNYKLASKKEFKTHSLFFYFTYDTSTTIVEPARKNRIGSLQDYFYEREKTLSSLIIPKNTFIIPSGHFGSVIYYYITNKGNVLGFLDNDETKQNGYLYGTSLLTYSMLKLKEFTDVNVLLHAGPYTRELIEQILCINPNTNIIQINNHA